MKELKINNLNYRNFKLFGVFEDMLNPGTEKICAGDNVDFYRDMIPLKLGRDASISFSVCRVAHRRQVVDLIECHSWTEESILPLNGVIAVLVAPASPLNMVPFEKFKVFRIPSGTMTVLKAGVWHSAPFVLGGESVSILITLPERTYANDSIVRELTEGEQVRIR